MRWPAAAAGAGTADLDSPQFGVDPGCKISKAKLFCVPATKTNVAVTDKKTDQPITPLPVQGGASGARPEDRVCYKVKCPAPTTPIADQTVTDQFGSRTIGKFKAFLICTPAFKGTPRFVDNGNSITDNYTGLQWMDSNGAGGGANFSNPQDADNTYTWSSSGSAPDGTVFTNFLGQLNGCTRINTGLKVFFGFAAHCDWRLPTFAELSTIRDCSIGTPCIAPIFGPTALDDYWTAETHSSNASLAWTVDFLSAFSHQLAKNTAHHVRAVRGGSGF